MIRSTFGSEVIIGQDGRITKRYSLGTEAGHPFVEPRRGGADKPSAFRELARTSALPRTRVLG